MTSFQPFQLALDLALARVNFTPSTGHNFKAMLLSSAYTGAKSQTHSRRNQLTAYEVSGTGYTAGGKAITVATAALVSNAAQITFNPPTWDAPAGPGWTPHWMAIYDDLGSAANDIVVALIDLTASPDATNGTTWTAQLSGPLTVTIPIGT
jgi:hypothetical protein